jgi:hypothetical protein
MEFEKHVKVRQEKFGAVVFETLREKVFVTNGTGSEIISSLKSHDQISDVIDALAERHNCSSEEIKGDVEDFVIKLTEHGIIKREEQ